MSLQFDTSGVVRILDLSPFVQGYVEALLNDYAAFGRMSPMAAELRFSDLAPETLTRIMEDCTGFLAIDKGHLTTSRSGGAAFWGHRQARHSKWPPLTLDLGDDGKVYLR